MPVESPHRVTYKDLQQLNKYTDELIHIHHALDLNLKVLKCLQEETERRRAMETEDFKKLYKNFENASKTCITEHKFLKEHVLLVRDCAERLTTHVSNCKMF